MYKQCRTEQSASRQRQLEHGLMEAMLKKRYDEISVTDLCEELAIPRKAFYRYFSDKDGALQSLIDHTLMDFDTYSYVNGIEDGEDAQLYMEKVFLYWIENKQLLDALAYSGLTGILVERAIRYAQELDNLPHFLTTMEQSLRNYGTLFAVCGLMTMIVQWHRDGFDPELSQISQVAIRLLSEPLFQPEG